MVQRPLWVCRGQMYMLHYMLFPMLTFGRIAEVLDEGKSSCRRQGCVYGMLMLFQLQWLLSCIYREKLRSKFGLPDEPCCDCCVHFCCESCALCQEHAELKHTGLDPSKEELCPHRGPRSLFLPGYLYSLFE